MRDCKLKMCIIHEVIRGFKLFDPQQLSFFDKLQARCPILAIHSSLAIIKSNVKI